MLAPGPGRYGCNVSWRKGARDARRSLACHPFGGAVHTPAGASGLGLPRRATADRQIGGQSFPVRCCSASLLRPAISRSLPTAHCTYGVALTVGPLPHLTLPQAGSVTGPGHEAAPAGRALTSNIPGRSVDGLDPVACYPAMTVALRPWLRAGPAVALLRGVGAPGRARSPELLRLLRLH